MPTMPAKIIHVSIDRPSADVAAFAARPENMPLWASGLASGLEPHGKDWIAKGPLGDIIIRFAPDNALGVIDHDVTLPNGQTVNNPLRVVANGDGAEVMFTLFRQPDTSEQQFADDSAWVEKDLKSLKTLLESNQAPAAQPASAPGIRIDYVEINVSDIPASKAFYGKAFDWRFTDYGPNYCEFNDGRTKGGLTTLGNVTLGGPLVILFSDDLEGAEQRVRAAGGAIVNPITPFPGGRRFHFTDPDGYELAVWSHR